MSAAQGVLLATEAASAGGTGAFLKGLAVFIGFMVFFVGGTWLLSAMVLGAKLGYFVTGASLFAVFSLISAIWFVTALGPRGAQGFLGSLGEDTAWHTLFTGEQLGSLDSRYGQFDVADYPNGSEWVVPGEDRLADLKDGQSTGAELDNARPVMEAMVAEAVSPIPGIKERAQEIVVGGPIGLVSGQFAISDVRMKEVEVAGKESIIAVGRAVPKATMTADLGDAAEGELIEYLVEVGDAVEPGTPVAELKPEGPSIRLTADQSGRVLSFGFAEGDAVKAEAPLMTLDVSGQPGAPQPVEVSAARVRGSIRVPSFIYLVASLIGLAFHLVGLQKIEKESNEALAPQTA
ncbi:MAG: biotin/lipoyl-containing protein [Actinomycetota bacterium]